MKGLNETVLQQAFGQVVKGLRRGRGDVSQADAAFRAGIDRTSWSLFECGHRVPSLIHLWRMAEALKIAPHELMAMTTDTYELIVKESETHAGIVAPLTGTSVSTSDT